MDRIAPTRRPPARAVGRQSWRELLFLHWSLDPRRLDGLLPAGLTVDTYGGRAYVGLVPFAMRHVRPRAIPRALGLSFLESNVRTYVHREGEDPGVFFFSLDAASALAVTVARLGWSLPYFRARMSLEVGPDGWRRYETTRASGGRPSFCVRYRPLEALGASEPGSLQHFLLERYLLYVGRRGALYRGQVHHDPYPVYAAAVEELRDGYLAAAGVAAEDGTSDDPPETVHYSPGVDVEIFPLRRL